MESGELFVMTNNSEYEMPLKLLRISKHVFSECYRDIFPLVLLNSRSSYGGAESAKNNWEVSEQSRFSPIVSY